MSGCILVMWGRIIPLNAMTPELTIECEEWHGPGYLDKPYSGNSESPWTCGVEIVSLKQYSYPSTGYYNVSLDPTEEHKRQAEESFKKLPESIRKHMTPVGRYAIPLP